MIKVEQSELKRSLPPVLAEMPETASISYAVGRQVAELSGKAEAVRIYSSIDTVPETVLDMMAAELMSPQYDTEYSVEAKRNIVRNSLLNWITNGTVAQLTRTVEEIFGEGSDISEWFEYTGTAGCFKVTTDNPDITDETVDTFKEVINATKRLSAKLDGVILALSVAPFQNISGFVVQNGSTIELTQKEE